MLNDPNKDKAAVLMSSLNNIVMRKFIRGSEMDIAKLLVPIW